MPLAVNDEVALINTTVSTEAFARRGNVLFGIVTDDGGAGTPVDVIFENGNIVSAVVAGVNGPFDKIVASGAFPNLVGKVVYPIGTDGSPSIDSPEYRCIVVRAYTRQTNGEGDSTPFVLLKSLQTGEYFESLPANVQVIPGQ